jgi:cyanate permease
VTTGGRVTVGKAMSPRPAAGRPSPTVGRPAVGTVESEVGRVRRAGAAAGRPGVLLVGLLALATNLRAALAGYPPLLETARAELGSSAGAAGLAQTGAVLMMAAGSFVGTGVGARYGYERALGGAVGLVAVGSLVRGVPSYPTLLGGSLLIGVGIGMAGVLLTGVVKERLAARAGAVTGGYVVAMMVGATVAGAAAVPLAVALGGWSLSLAVWAVPAVVAAAAWTPWPAGCRRRSGTGRGRRCPGGTGSPGWPAATRRARRCWCTGG